jgi:hypothetical protein
MRPDPDRVRLAAEALARARADTWARGERPQLGGPGRPGGPGGYGGTGSPPVTGGGLGGVVPPGEIQRPRDLAESDLTRALRAAFSQPGFRASLNGKEGADELLAEVEAAAHQVFLARKFYNDVVAATREARRRPLARILRLSGRAQAPEFFEMDDSLVAESSGAPLGL